MRDALQIRYHTGHQLVLQESGRIVGLLGDSELYHALLGNHPAPRGPTTSAAVA
ncbi:hypothetical protein D3C85_1939360 [compost metagenome]